MCQPVQCVDQGTDCQFQFLREMDINHEECLYVYDGRISYIVSVRLDFMKSLCSYTFILLSRFLFLSFLFEFPSSTSIYIYLMLNIFHFSRMCGIEMLTCVLVVQFFLGRVQFLKRNFETRNKLNDKHNTTAKLPLFFQMQVIRENCHLYTMMAHSVLLVLTTEAEPHGKLCQHFSIYLNM